ncbi:MAG TPA: 3-deoxy-D-manno-octulosonic acid transferase [Gemmataceae bacterium]|nr:3-deoxy-D-manno-octulosonic acid transferase [Gemmataceae bacterium]
MFRPLDFAYLLGLAAASPWLLYRSLTTGRYRRHPLARLFGGVSLPATKKPRAWFHGVSVGEIHLLRQVVAAFRKRRPDWECVISSTTDTGLDEARRCFPDLPVIVWPLDFSWAVKRALNIVKPRLLVMAEGELWPNMLRAAKARRIRVAVVNGRLSPKSARRYQRLGAFARPMFQSVDLFAVQTDEYAESIKSLGVLATKVAVTGSVKYDGLTCDRNNAKTAELGRLFAINPGDLVWVAGSTQAPEEKIVLSIWRQARKRYPKMRLILVPRQKDRFGEVADLVRRMGCPIVRRSSLKDKPLTDRDAVVLVDTIGELGAVWGLADIAFVGGSLDGKRGGQNMLEPAAYGAAVIFGPHVWNFRDAANRLVREEGAVQVVDAVALEGTVLDLLADGRKRKELGATARKLVLAQQGATRRTLEALDFLVSPTLAKAG